ncbi:MAG: hypothetical protein RG741_07500 [Bacteroidales bacterium]|nr:hypothetical protein [Bacteroidales bacterium]
MKPKLLMRHLLLPVFLMFINASLATGQYGDPRAAEILETVRQHYEKSIEGINDYVVVTEHFTTHYRKKFENGRPYFESRVDSESFWDSVSALGMHTSSPLVDFNFFDEDVFRYLKENIRYMGMETIDGMAVHVLYLDDMQIFAESYDDGPMGDLHLYFDDEHWVLRKMRFSAQEELDEGYFVWIEPVLRMEDYRNIEGMMIPFRTRITVEGLIGDLSEEERLEVMAALEELERELEQMTPFEREMLEQMLSGQLDQLRSMIEDDKAEFIIEVSEVRVNTVTE